MSDQEPFEPFEMRGLAGRDRRWIQIIASKISGGSRNATLPPLFISALAVCQSLLPLFDQAGARSQPFLGQCPSHKASHKRGECHHYSRPTMIPNRALDRKSVV